MGAGQVRIVAHGPFRPKDHELREVPLSWRARAAVRLAAKHCQPEQEYLFVSQNGSHEGEPLPAPNFWRDFDATVRRAGLVARQTDPHTGKRDTKALISLHDLRAARCTHWLDELPPQAVQEWMGHADIKTTIKHYARTKEEHFQAAADHRPAWLAERPKLRLVG